MSEAGRMDTDKPLAHLKCSSGQHSYSAGLLQVSDSGVKIPDAAYSVGVSDVKPDGFASWRERTGVSMVRLTLKLRLNMREAILPGALCATSSPVTPLESDLRRMCEVPRVDCFTVGTHFQLPMTGIPPRKLERIAVTSRPVDPRFEAKFHERPVGSLPGISVERSSRPAIPTLHQRW